MNSQSSLSRSICDQNRIKVITPPILKILSVGFLLVHGFDMCMHVTGMREGRISRAGDQAVVRPLAGGRELPRGGMRHSTPLARAESASPPPGQFLTPRCLGRRHHITSPAQQK